MSEHPLVSSDSEEQAAVQKARRGLGVYLLLVVLGSAVVQSLLISAADGITHHTGLVFALMWTPAVASLVTRLVLREGPRDVSFRLGANARRPLLIAWLFPLVVGLIAYGFAWTSGLETFQPRPMASLGLQDSPVALRFLVSLGVMLTLGTLLSALSAVGEEIGWRGYMLTRLIDAGVPRPILVSSLIWGLWHTPLIVSGQYASGPYPVLSAFLFLIGITGGGYVAARARLESGSIWPATLFHASWNSLIQGTFDGFTRGGDTANSATLWTGESGILVALTSLSLALFLYVRPFSARYSPADPSARELSIKNA